MNLQAKTSHIPILSCCYRWLREELEKTDAMWYFLGYSVIPECEEPLYLKHKNWFLARADLYGCVPVISTSQPDILAQIGKRDRPQLSQLITFCLIISPV